MHNLFNTESTSKWLELIYVTAWTQYHTNIWLYLFIQFKLRYHVSTKKHSTKQEKSLTDHVWKSCSPWSKEKKNLDFYSISGMQFNERSIARIMSQISVSLHEHVVGGSRVRLYRYRWCVVRLRSMCFCSERSLWISRQRISKSSTSKNQ